MSNVKKLLISFIVIMLVSTFGVDIHHYFTRSLNNINAIAQESEIASAQAQQAKSSIINKPVSSNDTSPKAPSPSPSNINSHCLISPLETISYIERTYFSADGIPYHKTVKKYYQLTTNLNDESAPFINQLTQKLDAVFLHIENILGITLNKTIPLNFIFQTSRADYENYITELAFSAEGNQGLYIFPNNIAIIEVKNTQQALNTATHEAIHAFNRAYLGATFNFFNEGMAEYFEVITSTDNIPPFDFSWLTHQQYPHQVSTLLFSEVDWHSNQASDLYQNSKALFYFLMTNSSGKQVIQEIVQQEMCNPCDILTKDAINDILINTYENHQPEFDDWFKSGLAHFLAHK